VAAASDRGYSAPPLPLAGEGWGEGKPEHLREGLTPCFATSSNASP
jgi:hypothetical protein